jgi:hypothetical protein
MSTKGIQSTDTTKLAISRSKKKIAIPNLVNSYNEYLQALQVDQSLLPSITSFALFANVNRQYLLELAQTNPEVTDIIEDITTRQENYCLQNGITNKANSTMAIFILKSKHNFRDQNPQLTQNNNFNISPDILKQALLEMNDSDTKK